MHQRKHRYPKTVTVEPELIVRESTGGGRTLGIAEKVYLDGHTNPARKTHVKDELFKHLPPEFSSAFRIPVKFLSKYR